MASFFQQKDLIEINRNQNTVIHTDIIGGVFYHNIANLET